MTDTPDIDGLGGLAAREAVPNATASRSVTVHPNDARRQPADLDAIRARAEAATPGPWEVADRDTVRTVDRPATSTSRREPSTAIAQGYEEPGWFAEPDAEFIAHAREDVPALLDEVERLRERLGLVRPDPKYRDPKTLDDALVALGATQNALVDACAAKHEAQAKAQRSEAERDRLRAAVDAVRHILSSGYADLAAFQADLREAVGLDTGSDDVR